MKCCQLTFTGTHVTTRLEQYRCLLVRANHTLFNLAKTHIKHSQH